MTDRSRRQSEESSDFISFSGSPSGPEPRSQHTPQQTRPYFRSPRGYNNSNRNSQGFSGRPHMNHSTPYNRNQRSFHNNFRHSTPQHNRRPFNNGQDKDANFDITKYFHPSMLENPWAQLEEELKNRVDDDSSSDSEPMQSDSDDFSKNESINTTR
ncbi:uncharacterized protein LOC143910508 [Arctopsyche grandis]|uniref:uncharacterized protein LOC143910508 n=1 Tax=Arctopsyche grandis TaxID=121162 RepID=UPI00406DA48A